MEDRGFSTLSLHTAPAHYQADNEDDQEDNKQDFRNSRRGACDSGKAENTRNDREDEKNYRIIKHCFTPFIVGAFFLPALLSEMGMWRNDVKKGYVPQNGGLSL